MQDYGSGEPYEEFLEGHEAVRAWHLYPREQDHRLPFEMLGEAWNLSIVLTIITFVNITKNGTTLCAIVKVLFNNPLDMCNRNRPAGGVRSSVRMLLYRGLSRATTQKRTAIVVRRVAAT